jgi:hypothetical protein
MRQSIVAAIVPGLLVPALAWGLGRDYPKGPIGVSGWPAGLAELVNVDNRVHGFLVNSQDVIFFSGNTKALNDFLMKYSKLANTKLQLVIHTGKLEVRSPWDQAARDIAADWKLSTGLHDADAKRTAAGMFGTRVDVWLSGSIQLSDLKVPQNVSVKSGGEIESFVKKHREEGGK